MGENGKISEVLANLRVEFLNHYEDLFAKIAILLELLTEPNDEWLDNFLELKREIHGIKGQAATFGFSAVGSIAHRLEDFIDQQNESGTFDVDGIYIFFDHMRAIISSGENLTDLETEQVLQQLPSSLTQVREDASAGSNRVLIVMPRGIWQTMVSEELERRGFEISFAGDAMSAITLALETPLAAVVTGMVLGRISGVDLARMFKAIEVLSSIPVIIFTSYNIQGARMGDLPDGTIAIAKGPEIEEKISELLNYLDLPP